MKSQFLSLQLRGRPHCLQQCHKLLVVMPATNAVSERSFSAMRRLYTYTRTNMSQSRLNPMMILHVHKTKADSLSLINIANEFVKLSDHRLAIFGEFTQEDLRAKIVPLKSQGISVKLKLTKVYNYFLFISTLIRGLLKCVIL